MNIQGIENNSFQYMEKWNFKNWGEKYWSKTLEFMEYVESS